MVLYGSQNMGDSYVWNLRFEVLSTDLTGDLTEPKFKVGLSFQTKYNLVYYNNGS